MSNNKPFHDRLDDLFSEEEMSIPEPDGKAGAPIPPAEVEDDDRHWIEERLASLDISALDEIRERVGWEDFLNAIDRSERIGFSFDEAGISPLPDDSETDLDEKSLEVPLQIGDEILGALQLEDGEALPEEAAELLASIAQQVTAHVENLRLLAQAEQYRAEAEQATRRLTYEGWQDYLQSAIAPNRAYFYDNKQVRVLDPQEDLKQDEASINEVDVLVRGQLIGKISIADPQEDPQKSSELINTITNRLAAHIENLRLLDETEFSRMQLDKRAAELETVAQVSTAAATILDPQALLQSVMDLTQYSFDLYHLSIYLIAENGHSLEFAAGAGSIGQQMLAEGHTIQLGHKKSVIAKVARTREVVIVTDASSEKDFLHHKLLPDTLSEMALPMIVADELIGVFNVESEQVGRFTEEDIHTFTTLASQTAVALRNAQLYAEQMQTVERLRELDELKSSFLANMSHELRTPLNSILGFTELILEGVSGPITDDMQSDLDVIQKNGQHLLSLINDVLDMAKIEAGRIDLTLAHFDLHELFTEVVEIVSPLAAEKSLELVLETTKKDDLDVIADRVRLSQVMINIVNNAVKFTDAGSVTIRADRSDDIVLIAVEDTGLGIPEDKVETIFEAFGQVDTSTTRKAGGTGLGLPISRRLIELHNGRLWVESSGVPGEGSIFWLELPVITDQ